jgi:Plasmid pRiA4b ORF-3-like protein
MLIQCTKKLLDELKVSPATQVEDGSPLLSWHANMLKIGRHKFMVLVNDQNRYTIVLYGLKAKDKKNIDRVIIEAIREVFKSESIKGEIIEGYMDASSEYTFAKTKDRKLVARLNKACESVHFAEDYWDPDSIIQVEMSKWISSTLVGDGKNSYFYPNQAMYEDLKEMSGQTVFDREALVLKVTLELDHHSVWRRIRVPANISFIELHGALQTAFSWHNSHLHDFTIYEKRDDGSLKQCLQLVCDEEAFSYEGDIPLKMETGYQVKPFLSGKIVYTYDFGDDWEHTIELEQVLHDSTVNYPVCVDGEGNAPPEDVGAEPGFDHFLTIIQDPSHPDHVQMKEWGEMQGYEEFDSEEINWRLKMR